MKTNHTEQIILYIVILFGALMLGVVARLGAIRAGVDNFTATVIFCGVAALGIALSLMIRIALEESLNWLLNRLFPFSFNRVVKAEEGYTTLPQTETKFIDTPLSSQPIPDSEIKTESTQEIEADMIFRLKIYDKFLLLENKLIKDKYLNEELHWISMHDNGKVDIKRLVIFLTGLVENNYFLPNRDPKIKIFFESRYNVTIGQNFEKKRRESLMSEYKEVFYDYPF